MRLAYSGEPGRGVMSRVRLSRSSQNKMIAGVCGGLAEYYGISSKRVRWAFFVFGLLGAGEVAYIVLWILLPKGPQTMPDGRAS
jgi:phage shock protein C